MSFEQVKERVKDALRRCECLIVVGPTGCGKTYAIQKACEEMGYRFVDFDAVDIDVDALKKYLTTAYLVPTAIVVDIVDALSSRLQKKVFEVAKNRINPAIFTAYNMYSLVDETGDCQPIQMFKPDVRELSKFINNISKETGLKPNYIALNSRDWRQAMLSIYGSEGYDTEDTISKTVEKFFRFGEVDRADSTTLTMMVDNVGSFYGIYAYLLLKYASIADFTKRGDVMKVVGDIIKGMVSKPKSSYFIEKLKLIKGR